MKTVTVPPLAVADQLGGRAAARAAGSLESTQVLLPSHTLVTLTVTESLGVPAQYEMLVSGVPSGTLVHWLSTEQFSPIGPNSSQLADTVLVTPKPSVTDTPRLHIGRKIRGTMTSTGWRRSTVGAGHEPVSAKPLRFMPEGTAPPTTLYL